MRRRPRSCEAEVEVPQRLLSQVDCFAYRVPLVRHAPDLDDLRLHQEGTAVETHGDGLPLPTVAGCFLAMVADGRRLLPGSADLLPFMGPREGEKE